MNKAVFITGGQSGTGFGIADFFARQGWNVIVSGQRGEEARAAAKRLSQAYGIDSKGYELDLRNEQQMIDIFNDIDNDRIAGHFIQAVGIHGVGQAADQSGQRYCGKQSHSNDTHREWKPPVIGKIIQNSEKRHEGASMPLM